MNMYHNWAVSIISCHCVHVPVSYPCMVPSIVSELQIVALTKWYMYFNNSMARQNGENVGR